MSRLFHDSPSSHDTRPAPANASHADAGPPVDHDDVMLGFECADPTLQIERWGQETQPVS